MIGIVSDGKPAGGVNDVLGTTDIRIISVEESAERQRISRAVLEALPDWFGIPESRE